MRRILAGLALALLIVTPVAAAKPIPVAPSIVVNEVGPFAIGDPITFTVTVPKLRGREYPLVYLACRVEGRVVYGQLDLPTTTFILGGGASPWIDPNDPDYLAPAICIGYLYAYGSLQSNTQDLLAQTAPFAAG